MNEIFHWHTLWDLLRTKLCNNGQSLTLWGLDSKSHIKFNLVSLFFFLRVFLESFQSWNIFRDKSCGVIFARHPNLLKSCLHCYLFWEVLIYHYFIILFLLCICIDVAIYFCKYKVWIENVKTQKLFSDPSRGSSHTNLFNSLPGITPQGCKPKRSFTVWFAPRLSAGKISLRDTVIYLIANTCIFFVALQLSYEKNSTQQKANISQGSSANRYTVSSAYQYKSHYAPVGPMGVGQSNSSRSEPNMALHQRTVPSRSGPSKRIQTMKTGASRSQKATSQFITRTTVPPPQYAANDQTKANNQFIYSRIDTVKSPKPTVTEPAFKSKMDSGWGGKYSLSFPEFHI